MIDLITMLVTFAIVAYINIRISKKIEKEVSKSILPLKQKIDTTGTESLIVKAIDELKVEKYNDVYYFFDEKSDQFSGQGSSLEQAARHFTLLRGSDILGCFALNDKKYCFINNECLPFERIG